MQTFRRQCTGHKADAQGPVTEYGGGRARTGRAGLEEASTTSGKKMEGQRLWAEPIAWVVTRP